MSDIILLLVGFAFVCLASQHIGKLARLGRLPLITGYLVAGAMVGPFILDWVSQEGTRSLRVVDHTALAFIAFAAGNELYLKEVRSRIKEITWTTLGLVLATFTLGAIAVLVVADHVPFIAPLPGQSRIAVALMAASILVARSPSSAIAIITEVRARGPFTKTTLGVTVVMDAVVILLFAATSTVSQSLVEGVEINPWFILRVVLDLLMSLNIGYITGKLLQVIVSGQAPALVRSVLVLAIGLGAFWIAHSCRGFSETYLGWPISPEPLLACMIAGFVVTNYSGYRTNFAHALEGVAPLIYLLFFTLVGASLALDSLVKLWPIALILFGVRLLGIVIGSVGGGVISGGEARHIKLGWMAYVTQAGVGLGLAQDVAVEFGHSFGGEFATMIVAIIVINQVVGPPMFKFALKGVGESHLPATATPDEVRDATILGIDDQAVALAQQLKSNGWQVVMGATDDHHVDNATAAGLKVHLLERIDQEQLSAIVSGGTDALVAMLPDDDDNYAACELCFENFGVPRLVVRPTDLSYSDRFDELGALVVEPASAMVNLMDQFVRVPRLATMLMHRDPEHEVRQVTIADPDIAGMPLREVRLPQGVRVLGITRDGHAIVPQGNTILHRNDEVTLVGGPGELAAVINRWGY